MSFAAIYKKLVEGINFKSLSYRNANDAIAIENFVDGGFLQPTELANKSATATGPEFSTKSFPAVAVQINTWNFDGGDSLLIEVLNYPLTGQTSPAPGNVYLIKSDGTPQVNTVTIIASGTMVFIFPTPFDYTIIKATLTGTANFDIKYMPLTYALYK